MLIKLPPTYANTFEIKPLNPLVNAFPISYPWRACTPVLKANWMKFFLSTSRNPWLIKLIPKGAAKTLTKLSRPILVAAAITVSIENNDFKAASKRPVKTSGVKNRLHIKDVEVLIAIAAIDALATPAIDTRAGPSTLAPKYAMTIEITIARGAPIDY